MYEDEDIKMLHNLVYLSGPHGSGKTTLGKALAKYDSRIIMPDLYTRNIKLHTEKNYRQILKMSSRALENYECLMIAKEYPEKIILGNRCIYDVLSYGLAYLERGWITEEMHIQNMEHIENFFPDENSRPLAIILNPGFEVMKKHLFNRWSRHEKKLLEEDMEYNNWVCKAYSRLNRFEKVLYIDREIESKNWQDIKFVHEWIINKTTNLAAKKSLENTVVNA